MTLLHDAEHIRRKGCKHTAAGIPSDREILNLTGKFGCVYGIRRGCFLRGGEERSRILSDSMTDAFIHISEERTGYDTVNDGIHEKRREETPKRRTRGGTQDMSYNQRTRMSKAVLAVAILLVTAIPLATILADDGNSDAWNPTVETHTVVYHPYYGTAPTPVGTYNSTTTPSAVTVTYRGHVFSTEYNPQFWNGTIKGTPAASYSNWYSINSYSTGNTLVFTGWVYGSSTTTHYPGEVVSSTDAESAKDTDGNIHIYATWSTLVNYGTSLNSTISGGSVYSNIIVLSSDLTSFSVPNGAATIRSADTSSSITISLGGTSYNFSYDTIIDNVTFSANSGANHGDIVGGLLANGHALVLGTGIGLSSSVTSVGGAPQVYGGNSNGTVGSTNVIIHSGIYYNVVAGGHGCTVNGDTKLVMRGGVVLDTVIGGCSRNGGTHGTVNGNTNVYLLGDVRLIGDFYEEKSLNSSYAGENNGKITELTESTILTGGSNDGSITGNTNVHISGNASAWDVQGGGRRGSSSVAGTANVTVSGDAAIKHTLCGSITDGLYTGLGYSAKQCVKNVCLTVKDNAYVASAFGAGYDTFYPANYSSMYGSDSSIQININGGTVGYVYGGGYRGAIGYTGADATTPNALKSIEINIAGGRVLYDVFGGGRGGLDKTCHNATTYADSWSVSDWDTTGRSHVSVGTISITVGSNATVYGNVYGGGESTPVITSYDGLTTVFGGTLGSNGNTTVASVYCDSLTINVDGTVKGSVYGAGKGVNTADVDSTGRHNSAYIFALKYDSTSKEYSVAKIPWIGNGSSTGTVLSTGTDTYKNYAYVETDKVTVNVSGTVGSEINTDGVYGGGEIGLLGSDSSPTEISVTVSPKTVDGITSPATVNGSVYGAGKGNTGSASYGAVYASSVDVSIDNGKVMKSVYGGGELGSLGSETNPADVSVTVSSAAVGDSVYGAGKGNENTLGYGAVYASSVNVGIDGDSTVADDVFGGGEVGRLGSSAHPVDRITVTLSSGTVNGEVYGTGKGKTGSTEYGQTYVGTVNVKIGGTSSEATVGNGSYAVFGTSQYAYTDVSDKIYMTLGRNAVIKGDVHAGGFGGEVEENSAGTVTTNNIVDASRQVVLNGAYVTGSLYGGSRLGDDGTTGNTKDLSIYLIAGTVEYDVYGGGFQGKSYLNVGIYFGTPAVETSGESPYYGTEQYPKLTVHSIYGGGHMSGGEPYVQSLLYGNVTLNIGSSSSTSAGFAGYGSSASENILIKGDVYGEGNYSKIEGTSTVTFSGYQQDSNTPIQSLQRITDLHMTSTSLILQGSADGGSQDLSHRLSMSRIGTLTMDGAVTLDLLSETYLLEKLVSSVKGTALQASECSQAKVRNTIILSSGPILRVGQTLNGSTVEYVTTPDPISGYTYLKVPDGETYWGAFVIGPNVTYTYAGFMTGEAGNIPAGDITTDKERIWYVSGHSTMTRMAVLESGKSWSTTIDMSIPRIGSSISTTKMVFSMPYIDSDLQGGLYSVSGSDYTTYKATSPDIGSASYVSMAYTNGTSTGYVSTHSYDSGWQPVSSGGYEEFDGNVTVHLESYDLYNSGKGSSGIVGNVVVSVTEAIKLTVGTTDTYIPINSIDYIITIYVGPRDATTTNVELNFNMMVDDTADVSGSTHIDFPAIGKLTDYYLTKLTYAGTGKVYLQADKDYLGYNGWITTKYDSAREVPAGTYNASSEYFEFGEAGMKITSVGIDYSGEYISQITAEFLASYDTDTGSAAEVVYKCTINLIKKHQSNLYVSYEQINGEKKRFWIGATGSGTETDPWVLSWIENKDDTNFRVDYGTIIDRKTYSFNDGEKTILEALKSMVTKIPDGSESGKTFVYSENFFGWYIDEGTITQFDTSSEITNDTAIYGGFGIRITFNGVTTTPIVIRIEPNKSLTENNIGNVEWDETNGYYVWAMHEDTSDPSKNVNYIIKSKRGYELNPVAWVIEGTATEMSFTEKLIASFSLELNWEPKKYSAQITVNGSELEESYLNGLKFYERDVSTGEDVPVATKGSGTPTGTDSNGENLYSAYTWTMDLTYTRTFSVNFGDYCVVKHNECIYYQDGVTGGLTLTVRGINTSALGFDMPLADGSNTGTKNVVVDVDIKTAVAMPITLVGDTDYSQALADGNKVDISVETTDASTSVSVFSKITIDADSDSVSYVAIPGTSNLKFSVSGTQYMAVSYLKSDGSGRYTDTAYSNAEHTVAALKSDSGFNEFVKEGVKIYLCAPYTLSYDTSEAASWSELYATVTYTPCSPDGTAGTAVSVSGTETYTVYKGYTVSVTPAENYTFPDGYTVSGTKAVSLGNYSITGNAVVKPMVPIDVTLKIRVTLKDTTGTEVSDYSTLYPKNWTLSVSVNDSVPQAYTFDKQGNYEIKLASSSTYRVTVTMPGFDEYNSTVTKSKINDVIESTLTAIEYTVNYYGYDKETATYSDKASPATHTSASWDVITGAENPYLDAAADYIHTESGIQTWIKNMRESPEIVETLTPEAFGNSTSLYLYPLPDPHSMSVDTTVKNASAALEQWTGDSVLWVGKLFDENVTFNVKVGENTLEVSYNATTYRLSVPGELSGTGQLTLTTSDGLFRLNLTVVPSLTGAIV